MHGRPLPQQIFWSGICKVPPLSEEREVFGSSLCHRTLLGDRGLVTIPEPNMPHWVVIVREIGGENNKLLWDFKK